MRKITSIWMILPEEITNSSQNAFQHTLYAAEKGWEMDEEERSDKHLGNMNYPSNKNEPQEGHKAPVCWLDLCVAHPATAAKRCSSCQMTPWSKEIECMGLGNFCRRETKLSSRRVAVSIPRSRKKYCC